MEATSKPWLLSHGFASRKELALRLARLKKATRAFFNRQLVDVVVIAVCGVIVGREGPFRGVVCQDTGHEYLPEMKDRMLAWFKQHMPVPN